MDSTFPRWGEQHIVLEFSFAQISIGGITATQYQSLQSMYREYTRGEESRSKNNQHHNDSTGGLHSLTIRCYAYRLTEPMSLSLDELSVDNVYTPVKTRVENHITVKGYDFEAHIFLNKDAVDCYIGTFAESDLATPMVMENSFRVATAYAALYRGGIIFHSAAIVLDDQAYIFVGRSNAGKTTLTKKSHEQGFRVLSDDINLILPGHYGYEAYPVPFTGEFGRPEIQGNKILTFNVKAICLLSQSPTLTIKTSDPALSLARLLVGCPYVNSDPEEYDRIHNRLMDIMTKCGILDVQLTLDTDVNNLANLLNACTNI